MGRSIRKHQGSFYRANWFNGKKTYLGVLNLDLIRVKNKSDSPFVSLHSNLAVNIMVVKTKLLDEQTIPFSCTCFILYYCRQGPSPEIKHDFSGHVRTFPAFLDVVQLTETETCPV